ncbi:hypothetical protein [Streptomyces sp. CC228A]|nr:hypothetical protein [Streptomyces sp. CC228A]
MGLRAAGLRPEVVRSMGLRAAGLRAAGLRPEVVRSMGLRAAGLRWTVL